MVRISTRITDVVYLVVLGFAVTHDVADVEPYEGVLGEVEVSAHGEAGVGVRRG